jgi:hypothetical protein
MRADLAEDAIIWHFYSSTGLDVQDGFNYYCQLAIEGRPLRLPARSISDLVKATTPERTASLASKLQIRIQSRLQTLLKDI